MCLAQAGIAQSVEHFTRNEGVVSSSLISSLYMTDGSPVSLEYEDAGLFLCVWMCRGTPEEGGIARWMQSGMLLRFCEKDGEGRQRKVALVRGGCGRGTPEEGGIAPGCCGGGVITAWAAGDGVIAAGSAV